MRVSFTYAANITGVIVEVAWTPATQASNTLSVWVRDSGLGAIPPDDPNTFVPTPPNVAQKDGGSPIKIPVEAAKFRDGLSYDTLVRASAAPAAVAIEQPFKLYLTQFSGVPFNATFSALPSDR